MKGPRYGPIRNEAAQIFILRVLSWKKNMSWMIDKPMTCGAAPKKPCRVLIAVKLAYSGANVAPMVTIRERNWDQKRTGSL